MGEKEPLSSNGFSAARQKLTLILDTAYTANRPEAAYSQLEIDFASVPLLPNKLFDLSAFAARLFV